MSAARRIPLLAAALAILVTVALFPAREVRSTDRTNGAPDPGLFSALEKFHGHTCGGSLFGARLGVAAREAVRAGGGTGKLKAVYHDHSCPVDGIQVGAGTTYGNKALVVENRGEARLLLTAEGNGKSVEARLTRLAEERGLRSRELGKKARSLPEGSAERGRLEREVAEIFDWFRTAPTAEIVVVR